MKKFNGFEAYLIEQGLIAIHEQMVSDIERMLSEGKRPLMTTGYVDMVIKDTQEKLKMHTLKLK